MQVKVCISLDTKTFGTGRVYPCTSEMRRVVRHYTIASAIAANENEEQHMAIALFRAVLYWHSISNVSRTYDVTAGHRKIARFKWKR